jgi:competence protein ComEC
MVEWSWPRRLAAYVACVALTSLVGGLATAPFAIYHFNRLAAFGLVANLLAVPLTAFWIMPFGVVALLLMPLGLEAWAIVPMGLGVDAMIWIAKTVASWPRAVVLVPVMPDAALAAISLGGLWLCLWQRSWRLAGVVGIVLGLASIGLMRSPDILVTGDGRLMAVKAADGSLLMSSGRRSRFAADMWMRRAAGNTTATWPDYGASADGSLRCDGQGCLYRVDGHLVALPRDRAALAEDCALATVVVTALATGRTSCLGPALVIDRFDLWRSGAHAIWLEQAGLRVETVRGRRGARPWVHGP